MNPGHAFPIEKIAAVVAGALCVASLVVYRPGPADPAVPATATTLAEPDPIPAPARSRNREVTVWRKPAAQSSGPGWVYELFTPPAVYYDPRAHSFSVALPGGGDGSGAFGVELVAVKQELYRLQLAGYFGGPGDWLAAFTSPATPETLLARPGRHFEALGLTLKSFEVRKVALDQAGGPRIHEVAGFAVVLDDRSGTEVILDSRDRRHTDTPLAILRPSPGRGPDREAREGETWSDGQVNYRIERIQLDPPEVVIAKQAPGLPFPETVILRPGPATDGMAGSARPLPPVPTRSDPPSIATNR